MGYFLSVSAPVWSVDAGAGGLERCKWLEMGEIHFGIVVTGFSGLETSGLEERR
jgi:hypothetical protein